MLERIKFNQFLVGALVVLVVAIVINALVGRNNRLNENGDPIYIGQPNQLTDLGHGALDSTVLTTATQGELEQLSPNYYKFSKSPDEVTMETDGTIIYWPFQTEPSAELVQQLAQYFGKTIDKVRVERPQQFTASDRQADMEQMLQILTGGTDAVDPQTYEVFKQRYNELTGNR